MKLSRRQALPVFGAAGLTAAGAFLSLPGMDPLLGNTNALADTSDLMEPGPLGEHMEGNVEAPVTIIKYASMTCPHCRAWHKNVYPTIKAKYVDTGIAKFFLREFPFDPAAAAAFMLAHCSGEDRYFTMIDVLYERQSIWARGKVADELFKIAKQAGFSQQEFTTCLKDQKLLDNVLSIQKEQQRNIRSIPPRHFSSMVRNTQTCRRRKWERSLSLWFDPSALKN